MVSLSELEVSRRSRRLLVVDQDPWILNLVKSMQNRTHYEAVLCQSPELAKGQLSEGAFDCILLEGDTEQGLDLVRFIREIPYFKKLPIILVSSKRQESDVKRALEIGVSDYLLKPIDSTVFFDKIELWLKKVRPTREIFEHVLEPSQVAAQINFNCEVRSISETSLSVRLSLPIPQNSACELQTSIYQDIGIKPPLTRLISCEKIEEPPLEYLARFTFIGLPEAHLQKIRAWLIRQEIKRRK